MEEHRLVQKGTALERDGFELLHRAEERVVPQARMELELWVARCGRGRTDHLRRREARGRGARAEVMEAVRYDDPAKLAQRAERCAELLRGLGRAVHEEPAVFESQHRTPRAQTNPAKPHRPLAHPDRVRDDD